MTSRNRKLIPVYIEDEMKKSYLDYSMSVIVSRALPDVRDGLKPSQRRILVAMNDLNLTPGRQHRKCAKIAGDTSGNYHPHGEAVVYPTLVRMAQNFNLRYPLVDGQGNFGSVDGDPPAAMRYTEARMGTFAVELLEDLNKDTVDFVSNYDETRTEPTVLPARFPNLICNGCSGIAVGMATNIPPHNLGEVVDGLVALIDNPELGDEELMQYVKGPDFPTGAIIYGKQGIREAYLTGRGKVTLRALVELEEEKGGHQKIVITEIPFQVNKAALLENIAHLIRDKKIEGVTDLRDESDRKGMRIVIELRKEAVSLVVLNLLYAHTSLQTTFGVIMLALVDGQPKVLTLKQILPLFLQHRHQVVTRRTQFELNKAENRAHILAGLKIALQNIDEVISVIRKSEDSSTAKELLCQKFSLSETQAQAILDMRLVRLTRLEQDKVEEEYQELLKYIAERKRLLADYSQRMAVIKKELLELKQKYGDARRTEIVEETVGHISIEDLIAEEEMAVTISHSGYIKRLVLDTYRHQHRGGFGVRGMATKDEDFVEHLVIASTHDWILFLTDRGQCYWLKVYEIPEGSRISKGRSIVNLLKVRNEEIITAFVPVKQFDAQYFLTIATGRGIIKKTNLSAYSSPRKGGIRAISLALDDTVIAAALTDGKKDILLAAEKGRAVRFHETEVRETGRSAQGVRGMRLSEDDRVIGMIIAEQPQDRKTKKSSAVEECLLSVSENGYGKRTGISRYPLTHRGGKGVISIKVTPRRGKVMAVEKVRKYDEVMIISQGGKLIRLAVRNIRTTSRNTQGVKLVSLREDKVIDVATVVSERNI
ncbi:MAG: DNA gyrase subunit A [Candidatus Latescibacteria bacterium]|nr:DNA gyrase subunit A [Candidatus Latescibacterota bacterium]